MRVYKSWIYNNKPFKFDEESEFFGFVYIITNLYSRKRYIGKKRFYKALSRKPLKGRKNRRRYKKLSDWEDYYGSNKSLLEDVELKGKNKFKREILRLCTSPGEMSYYETLYQFQYEVLLKPNEFYNDWIMCKIHRRHLGNLK